MFDPIPIALNQSQAFKKRVFDILLSLVLLVIFLPLMVIVWILAALDTGCNGLFVQKRIGQYGALFTIYKIRTMNTMKFFCCNKSDFADSEDPRITSFGRFLRSTKIDELPQLFNIFLGQMSFVGPRPDVPGFADHLVGHDRIILSLRPGLTGPASLKYRNEAYLLSQQDDPISYNRNVIWPEKVEINVRYASTWCLRHDIYLIFRTIVPR